tara:strand:+ start:300 stop:1049 length:750 start_codon:yes stop_codon:yes gene_type:complete
MKMQELLIFVLILAGGAYIFMNAKSNTIATTEGCEINQTEGGGTVNYSGPDGCIVEFNVFDTKGAKDVSEVCTAGTANPCAEPFEDIGADGCADANEDGKGSCIEDGDDPIYNADNNLDPNGDNYNKEDNASGTEGNKMWEGKEPFVDTNKDKKWTQSLYVFNWWQEVVVKGKKVRTSLTGNKDEPWKLSYESAANGKVVVGIDVVDNYATSMNGESSSDTRTWSLVFNRKKVQDPKVEVTGELGVKAK